MTLPVATILTYLVMVGLFRSFPVRSSFFALFSGFIGVIWMLAHTRTGQRRIANRSLMMIGVSFQQHPPC